MEPEVSAPKTTQMPSSALNDDRLVILDTDIIQKPHARSNAFPDCCRVPQYGHSQVCLSINLRLRGGFRCRWLQHKWRAACAIQDRTEPRRTHEVLVAEKQETGADSQDQRELDAPMPIDLQGDHLQRGDERQMRDIQPVRRIRPVPAKTAGSRQMLERKTDQQEVPVPEGERSGEPGAESCNRQPGRRYYTSANREA